MSIERGSSRSARISVSWNVARNWALKGQVSRMLRASRAETSKGDARATLGRRSGDGRRAARAQLGRLPTRPPRHRCIRARRRYRQFFVNLFLFLVRCLARSHMMGLIAQKQYAPPFANHGGWPEEGHRRGFMCASAKIPKRRRGPPMQRWKMPVPSTCQASEPGALRPLPAPRTNFPAKPEGTGSPPRVSTGARHVGNRRARLRHRGHKPARPPEPRAPVLQQPPASDNRRISSPKAPVPVSTEALGVDCGRISTPDFCWPQL